MIVMMMMMMMMMMSGDKEAGSTSVWSEEANAKRVKDGATTAEWWWLNYCPVGVGTNCHVWQVPESCEKLQQCVSGLTNSHRNAYFCHTSRNIAIISVTICHNGKKWQQCVGGFSFSSWNPQVCHIPSSQSFITSDSFCLRPTHSQWTVYSP